jgi:hypothetical protein
VRMDVRANLVRVRQRRRPDAECGDLMLDRNRSIDQLLQMLTELGWKVPSGDVIDEIANGSLLTVAQAAIICEVTDQSILRWLVDAARRGRPLGLKRATWLIGRDRLFGYIEENQGLPARVKAQNRLKEYWPVCSQVKEFRHNA